MICKFEMRNKETFFLWGSKWNFKRNFVFVFWKEKEEVESIKPENENSSKNFKYSKKRLTRNTELSKKIETVQREIRELNDKVIQLEQEESDLRKEIDVNN